MKDNWGSWRTSLAGALEIAVGVALILIAPSTGSLAPALALAGMGQVTSGIGHMNSRDNKVRSESVMSNSELHDAPKKQS